MEVSQLDLLYDRIGSETDVIQNEPEESQIQKFYEDKTIFITGATGFMGKCLVEKLLRSCPNVRHVYILIREKKNVPVEKRMREYFQNKIFNLLRKQNPNFERKVTAMKGQVDLEKCGLSEVDLSILKREINIIFHGAANVMFNAKIRTSLQVNVLGVKNMLEMASEFHRLEAFIHLSTAYSHCCKLKCIEEKFYEPPGDLNAVQKLIEIDNERNLDENSVLEFIDGHPNIYTYAKAIAEDLVRQHSRTAKYACGIYRPSMVVSTMREPQAGWTDNLNGPVLLFLAAGLGVGHAVWHLFRPVDYVPCDLAINILIAMVPNLIQKRNWSLEKDKAVIYNYGSSTVNPVLLYDMYNERKNTPAYDRSKFAVFMNFVIYTRYKWLFYILNILFHFIPACLGDAFLFLAGKKRRLLKFYRILDKHIDKANYFLNGDWRIHIGNSLQVISELNSRDRELFFCDIRAINWVEWTIYMWRGMKLFILKESLSSRAGEYRYNLLWKVYYGLIATVTMLFIYFFGLYVGLL
ncbi:hypothetical protein QAD02_005251 [Eretmocerus hayati]|uniref:Uncharacterized protein n=1 Tax=Eretmocerus hayati TaxID=131215 RepID=A0ACC2NRV7_9HYME|nr:hypothetical protein QAD02_024463 [Eretmocerus hayati]KAJ8673989.1 hypothetical protein QAD02_005251 [Eretmocerus hayati]